MPVIVNNPPAENSNNNAGFLLGIIILAVLVILFFVYGLPYIRGLSGGIQVNIPDHVNVNVQNQGGK